MKIFIFCVIFTIIEEKRQVIGDYVDGGSMEFLFQEILTRDLPTRMAIFNKMFNRINDFIFIMKWDEKRQAFIYMYVNEHALSALQIDKSIYGKSIEEVFPKRADFLNEKYKLAIQSKKTVMYEESVMTHKGEFIGETALNPIFMDEGKSYLVFSIVRDVTDRKKAEEQATFFAYRDELTGLGNRRFFKQSLDRLIEEGKHGNQSFALILMDLDNFKMINDHYGHDVGDEVLKNMAKRIQQTVSSDIILCRIGGDEVALLCPNVTVEEARHHADELLKAFSLPLETSLHPISLDVSIGVAMYPDHATEGLTLIKAADISLYYVKNNGKNDWLMYSDSLGKTYLERISLEQALRDALVKEEFSLHYQPRIDAKSGKMKSVEALIRWEKATPDVFIPVAEETGLIHEIGNWVTKTACLQLKEWKKKGVPIEKVSINLSLHQLLKGKSCLSQLRQIIEETGVDPSEIEFEITERFISLENRMIDCLQKMRNVGVTISIDDFGKEYSSLWCLRKLPVDAIKLDRSFLEDISTDPTVESIVDTILTLSKTLNLRAVGEGIETEIQAKKLTDLGIHEMQGYLFSRPLPPNELEALFEKVEIKN